MRSRLVRQISSLNNEYESYIQQIKTLAASLKSPNLGIPTLVKLSKDYQSLQGGVEPLREKCDSNAKDFERFNDWGRLVKDGSELSDQLQEMGDAVRGERDKFQKLSQDIMGHLSANKTAALPDAPNFENRLQGNI
ncbi:MAG: hypothetical protein H6633_12710 [Anaerolineales bacterium]|nr:hypothetical protein [Anaerolineales bacterium]